MLTNLRIRYGDLKDYITQVIGEEEGKKVYKIWGINDEGDFISIAKEVGIPGLWYLSGNSL